MHSSRIECSTQVGAVRFVDPESGRVYNQCDRLTNCGVQWNAETGTFVSPSGIVYTPVQNAPTPDPKTDAVNASNERGAGLKFDSGKPRWTLLMQGCAKALAGVAKVLTFGAKKYAAHSWKEVENNEERYRDALYRHLNAIEGGEAIDPESGLSHWDHAACNALFLSQLNKDKPMSDLNRPAITEMVYKSLSNELHSAIDTGNEDWARLVLAHSLDATITKTQYEELRQDFETAFGDL